MKSYQELLKLVMSRKLGTRWQWLGYVAASVVLQWGSAAQAACPSNHLIDVTLDNGARWEACWSTDSKKGLVLQDITLTPKNANRTLILASATLAQVLVSNDDGTPSIHRLTDGLPVLPMVAGDCPDGQLLRDEQGQDLLCKVIRPRGYAWRGQLGQIQGQSLVLYSISATGSDTYIQQWVFDDVGDIQPMLGISGRAEISPRATAATGWPTRGNSAYLGNRYHTAYWRLDFALDGQDNDSFQQFEYINGTTTNLRGQRQSSRSSEALFRVDPERQRFWRVLDGATRNANGHSISYQIVLRQSALYRGPEAFTGADVYITQNTDCEQFASNNSINGECASGLPDFLNGQSISDLVAWVGTSWHQVPRGEDESGTAVHWQGIMLAPRDLTPTSPLM